MADATNLHRKPLAAIWCRDAARVEIGCDGTARCAVSLDAALDVRTQRLSPRGRLRRIDLGLLWIAELDATGFGGGAICDSRRVFHRPLASGQPQGCFITELSRFSD